VSNKFEFKKAVYGKMNGELVGLYPMPIQVGNKNRWTKNPVYMVFPITEKDYDFFKERAKYYEMYLKKEGAK
jgi:hypothetical protein